MGNFVSRSLFQLTTACLLESHQSWLLALQMQRTEGFKELISELEAAGSHWSLKNPAKRGNYMDHLVEFFASGPSLPLFDSIIAETLRFTTDSWSMRDVEEEETLLGPYTMKKGDTLICSTRSVHSDDEQFENAKVFNPTRFLKEGAPKIQPWGGGISMCEGKLISQILCALAHASLGRHFAYFYIKIFVTRLLKEFRFEIDRSKENTLGLGVVNRGFGVRRPKGDIFVNVSRL